MQNKTGRHYAFYANARTFVDINTNTMVLGGLEFERDFGSLIKGKLPLSIMGDALHEMMHHSSFHSPVGTALALLKIRAQHAIFRGKVQADIIEPEARLQCAINMLKPIAEGIALFSEFDLFPGPGDVIVPIRPWLLYLFARDSEARTSHELDAAIANLLNSARKSLDFAKRKENLLVQPFNINGGGYLPGYIFVKTLWNKFKSEDSTLVDAELFSCFIRSFFYDDLALSYKLLDSSVEFPESINRILNHIQGRVEELCNLSLARNIQLYHEEVRKITYRDPVEGPGINTDIANVIPGLEIDKNYELRAKQAFKSAYDQLFESGSEVPDLVRKVSMWIFHQRDLLWLGGSEGIVVVNKSGQARFFLHGQNVPMVSGPALPGVEEQSSSAAIEIFFSTNYWYLALIISVTSRPVLILTMGKEHAILQKQLTTSIVDRAGYMRMAEKHDETYQELLRRQPSFDGLSAVAELADYTSEATYTDAALHTLPEERRCAVRSAMAERGFSALLDNRLPLIRMLARAGVQTKPLNENWHRSGVNDDDRKALLSVENMLRNWGLPEQQISVERHVWI